MVCLKKKMLMNAPTHINLKVGRLRNACIETFPKSNNNGQMYEVRSQRSSRSQTGVPWKSELALVHSV